MKLPQEGYMLRIFIGESDTWQGRPLYEVIVKHARKIHMAGSTFTRGIIGFGADIRNNTAKLLRLSEELPNIDDLLH